MRTAQITRKTAETDIALRLDIDGRGESEIATGVGFLNHMLVLFSRHGRFNLTITCQGDTWVDDHHSVEDVGIALGEAFKEALGDKRGIARYGSCVLPMDETLMIAAADISGRGGFYMKADFPTEKIGTFDSELVKEFFLAFARCAGVTLHMQQMAGENSHHIAEAMFKAFGRAMRAACAIEDAYRDEIPSTKGVLA